VSAQDQIVELLNLLDIAQIVVVDDDFLAGPGEYVEAVEAEDAPKLDTLPAVSADSDLSDWVAAQWENVSVEDKLKVRRATIKGKRDYLDPTGLRQLIGEHNFNGLTMAEWEDLAPRVLSSAKRPLLLFDVDLSGETGKADDTTGLELAGAALNANGRHVVGLLTSKAAVGEEITTAEQWARTSQVQAADFVIVKQLLQQGGPDDIASVVEQIRTTLQAAQMKRLREKVHGALDKAVSHADSELGSRSPSILEDLVFSSSHEGGEWEGDTWFRLYTTLGLERARRDVALDPDVRSAISDVRRLLQSRPSGPHPGSAELAAEVEAAEAYQDADYVNGAGLPIANGDLFKAKEGPIYVLVGQPCDLALRPTGRAYTPTTATLLSLKNASATESGDSSDVHERSAYRLPAGGPMGPGQWEVRFRPEHHVSFDLLDLCSLNTGGKATTHPPKGAALDPLLPGLHRRNEEILDKQTKLQKLLAEVDKLQDAGQLDANAAKRFRLELMSVSKPFTPQLSRKPAAFEFAVERIGRLAGSYADALLAAHSSARARTAHAHELTRIVQSD
jgi:hypothetical protein